MLNNRFVPLLILILSAGMALGMVLSNGILTKTVEAQQLNNPKWEYCRVSSSDGMADNFGNSMGYAYIEYFNYPTVGRETLKVERASGDTALSQVFAKLGEAGWEMVQVDRSETHPNLFYYFKKAKR